MTPELEAAARRIHQRMCGTLASDLWPADMGHDEVAKSKDYELVAAEFCKGEPDTDMEIWEQAEVWIREHKDELFGS